ncbi:hypothetical protein JOL62DRAFT_41115 [Phyllosticta paracitricarpa]|uniref:Secreted protein n=1 Tax=Phyllosticta paracitricarpa TaxID=2016321 RepID=A0ABR1NDQ7_9PEZI
MLPAYEWLCSLFVVVEGPTCVLPLTHTPVDGIAITFRWQWWRCDCWLAGWLNWRRRSKVNGGPSDSSNTLGGKSGGRGRGLRINEENEDENDKTERI